MKFKSTNRYLASLTSDCLCIGLFQNNTLSAQLKKFEEEHDFFISDLLKSNNFDAQLAKTYLITSPTKKIKKILFVGLGKYSEFNNDSYRKALEATHSSLKDLTLSDIIINFNFSQFTNIDIDWAITYIGQFFIEKSYSFHHEAHAYFPKVFKDTAQLKKNKSINNASIRCIIPSTKIQIKSANSLLRTGEIIGEGINIARLLGDLPANYCTPTFLADFSTQLCDKHANLSIRVLNRREIEKNQMHAFLSVTSGSKQEPKLIEIAYKPKHSKQTDKEYTALIGKGITFDTGGISLKPSLAMDEMKFDMCGAASVIGTMHTIAKTQAVNHPVVAIVPTCENMPSGSATRPGDVIQSMSGKTIEVLNTDAEGRLILADAITYTQTFYKPKHIINVATLTGACVVALGAYRAGLMSNNIKLAKSLVKMGNRILDPCCHLPLDDEYDKLLHSNFADIANIASNREAGTLVAGCFLKRFVKMDSWAHIDIAGVAWNSGTQKGATGRPVSLLSSWLIYYETIMQKKSGSSDQYKYVKRGVIGPIIEAGLLAGKSNEEIIKEVLKQVPNARTSTPSITFYAHRLRKKGKHIPSQY